MLNQLTKNRFSHVRAGGVFCPALAFALTLLLFPSSGWAQESGNAETKKPAPAKPAEAKPAEKGNASARDAPAPVDAVAGGPAQSLVVVVGASGADEFTDLFRQWAKRWQEAASLGDARVTTVGLDDQGKPDRDLLQQSLKAEGTATDEPLWLVLIGHGTFDGRAAKFNLRGRDVAAGELSGWLDDAKRPIIIINCASSSGPFINRLSGPDRIVVTASKSGYERNFARFGDHLSEAILSGAADLDKDGQTSLLEAFLAASGRVAEFYQQEGRLATEHALLDDNGDKLGTPATFFRGIRAVKAAKKNAAIDGRRAAQLVLVRSHDERAMSTEQRALRDALETEINRHRETKDQQEEDAYYAKLEQLMVRLSKVLLDDGQSGNSKTEPKGER